MPSSFAVFVDYYATEILSGLVLLVFLFCILSLVQNSKIKRLEKRYASFMKGSKKDSLESLLLELKEDVEKVVKENKALASHIHQVEKMGFSSLRGWSLVRFNAFQETGSDLSFSAAIVDGDLNGFVLTSIFGRDENRIYAKPLTSGKSAYKLSREEEHALQNAKEKMNVYKEAR